MAVATGPTSAYPVVVGEGAADHLEAHLPAGCRRVAVVTDRSVEPLARRLAGADRSARAARRRVISLPAGEPVKSWAATGRLLERLAGLGLGRRDALVAVGGGSIGDMAGFAAAAYCRGIAWVVVPTTLLAMVDSSIGGKTGVNLRAAKNLAGAFWQPRAVLADSSLLDTLPARELASGLGEVAKYAMIAEGELPDLLDHGLERARQGDVRTLTAIIERCAAIKAEVVGRDPREGGLRAVLNYGHTVAHAIEAAAGYGTVTHGEAVAVGMRVAGRLSVEIGRAAPRRPGVAGPAPRPPRPAAAAPAGAGRGAAPPRPRQEGGGRRAPLGAALPARRAGPGSARARDGLVRETLEEVLLTS